MLMFTTFLCLQVTTVAGEEYLAGAVIVALPLGVLQASTCTFNPPLPDSTQEALARLCPGSLNTVALEFEVLPTTCHFNMVLGHLMCRRGHDCL